MKIQSVRIENFRSFKDETIEFGNYACLVGANGAGKSTVLAALNIFFRQYKDTMTDLSKLSELDFHHKNVEKPIKITVTFSELSEQATQDLSDYVRQETLVVSAIAQYNKATQAAEIQQYGNRLGFEEFRKYFEEDKKGASAKELKEIFNEFRGKYSDISNATSKADMADALRNYESVNPDKSVLIPSEDQFYGISKGVNKLAPHIQWVYVPASKNLAEESEESRNTVLGQLLLRTIRSKVNFSERVKSLRSALQTDYQKMLDEEQGILNDISESIENRLRAWSHPDISAEILWKSDPEKSVKIDEPWAYARIGERGFEGELARFGHGLQRSYMLALLQELSQISDESAPTLVMGIEEPEIYQHPPQIRYLAEVLLELSEKDSQIITCSHNPLFIPGDNFETVRVVREDRDSKSSFVSKLKYSELAEEMKKGGQPFLKEKGIMAKLYSALNPVLNEMFFCKKLILVEGIEDIAYIMAHLLLYHKMDIYRKNGVHIVSVGGKSELIKPICMANLLKIPVFVVCDADTDKTRDFEVTKHKSDNASILTLLGHGDESDWPTATIWKENLVLWKENITNEFSEDIGESWPASLEEAYNYYNQPGGLNKNPLAISRAINCAWEKGEKSDLMEKLVDQITNFASL